MSSLKQKIKDLFIPQAKRNHMTGEKFLENIEKRKFKNKFALGLSQEKEGSWLMRDFEKEPNGLFAGRMGSGKSLACRFTLLTWMANNSENSIVFLIDTQKGATDYIHFMDLPNVHLVDEPDRFMKVIDLVYDEMSERSKLMQSVGANSVSDYEKITGKKMARIVLVIEEFHSLTNNVMEFARKYKEKGTTAAKFLTLMRIGRSQGAWFLICTQKATGDADVPKEVVTNFANKLIFKVSPGESRYLLGNDEASRIQFAGRCFHDETGSTIQFPYVENPEVKKVIDDYIKPKPNISECAYLNDQIIIDYLSGKSNKEIYKHKKFQDLARQLNELDANTVVELFHDRMGCELIEKLDPELDPYQISQIVKFPNGEKRAVMIKTKVKKVSKKHIYQLIKGMKHYKCEKGVLYTPSSTPPQAVYKEAGENFIELIDEEDMLLLAQKLDRQESTGKQESFDPNAMASDDKESGTYHQEHNILDDDEDLDDDNYFPDLEEDESLDTLAEKIIESPKKENQTTQGSEEKVEDNSSLEEFIDDLDEDFESFDDSILDESSKGDEKELNLYEEISTQEVIESLKRHKRPNVSREFKLSPEDNPSILVHSIRNEHGEVYRILVYTLLNNNIKHKFYFDRKVEKKFDFIQMKQLSIENIDQWNNNPLVFSDEELYKHVDKYLNNFNICENPVFLICWRKDLDVVQKYFNRNHKVMSSNPTVLEDNFKEILHKDMSRDDILSDLKPSVGNEKFYEEIEKDYQLWTHII